MDGMDKLPTIKPVRTLAPGVTCFTTTRLGGQSLSPYDTLNLGTHVGDERAAVQANRARLQAYVGEVPIQWLDQVHGVTLHHSDHHTVATIPQADAAITTEYGIALALMTADCLPVVFAAKHSGHIAIAHAGWRGLANGVLDRVLQAIPGPRADIAAWIGPAIGQANYEVGEEVVRGFARDLQTLPQLCNASETKDRWLLDLPGIAQHRLRQAGVNNLEASNMCTHANAHLYSYRRDGPTGRMATVVVRDRC